MEMKNDKGEDGLGGDEVKVENKVENFDEEELDTTVVQQMPSKTWTGDNEDTVISSGPIMSEAARRNQSDKQKVTGNRELQ